ncbi:UTP--glucose-1-phosphate uridylyltransferase [Tautonia sociabilis]|uniref:UTP--glucose-1-phosphate uridylyltransferase n=1 Tax=Tautonia sociabilis TaxID=2080755 RepID=A0A432MPL0_9BACT|nr:UTP--glucose-1-phosphate uridylyltransferase [Tautonia sociabilis]RUL89384.1 UTP--glucose-1-phosphate uridylyltransferase [Tautonia sociabilis]
MADPNPLIETITSADPDVRDRPLRSLVEGLPTAAILDHCEALEAFRRRASNLYERVRASLFLHALYRYAVQDAPDLPATGYIPAEGVEDLMQRRFEQAISAFRLAQKKDGPNGTVASALAKAYEEIALQTLADQVRRSVRGCRGNRWMFRVGSADEHPLRLNQRLLDREGDEGLFPILVERTPVRLDLSHSGWSDIFFLGMDYPEGARVLNISVDLGVFGRDDHPRPPIETYCRVIAEPVLRLSSIDLNDAKDVDSLEELFNFGNDYLGLVKAGVIASGLVPPSLEGSSATLRQVLDQVVRPGYGLEVVSKVNDIPKGSRLAVSTNLLASLITLLMRATGQTRNLTGPLSPEEAPVVVARAILGEWLGGSGGGWQDSGGIFPGVKLIEGVPSGEDDPEFGVSRGRLLPRHTPLDVEGESSPFHEALANSLVLIHGGMAQNVGPILNMVTEKYLLRSRGEWEARQEALRIFDRIVAAVRSADVRALGRLTTENWDGPLKRIIPWVTNRFTESIIAEAKAQLGDDFWGFLMLGGMSGGGMAFFVAPHRRDAFRAQALEILRRVKAGLDTALPFAMEPVVYDFAINPKGTVAELLEGDAATMPPRYYTLQIPRMIAQGHTEVPPQRRIDIDHFASRSKDTGELLRLFRTTINTLFPVSRSAADPTAAGWDAEADRIRRENGFDPIQHEQLREDLQRGRIGLARNRLPVDTDIQDVRDDELIDARFSPGERVPYDFGADHGEVAVVSLAGGVGSRWTTGAGVVKAINPFVMLDGQHRSFLEIHLAKTRLAMRDSGVTIPHVVTTSYLTHSAIERTLERTGNYGHDGPVFLSRGQSIAQRLIPMARDLTFLWEEQAHETLDENKQKVREAARRAILGWAKAKGEGSDYVDNVPLQRFNPPGHFYEVPNLLRNGTMAALLKQFPRLSWLLVHNIDTLGADLDPGVFARVRDSGATLAFEVIPRRIDDRGGGLARVNGRLRLLEGLAQPREDVEFRLRYYNSLTTWVHIDGLLAAFGLSRRDLEGDPSRVAAAIRGMAARVPTYVTIKDVKRRWGHAQEDVLPVAQFEKLWGDLTALPDLSCAFLAVDRLRGQQLKDPAQLDGWANDGSLDHVRSLCSFDPS